MAPSPEQRRREKFADVVERAATRPTLLVFDPEPLTVRILTKQGHEMDFTATEVDVDGGELVGSGPGNQPIHLPLDNLKTVWRRRARIERSVAVWLSPLVAGAIAGAFVASGMGAVVGALLGAIVGAVAARAVHNWKGMYQWEQLYGDGRIVK